MLIAFSGFKTAGKDAAASVLINEYGFRKVALADPVKQLVYAINPAIPLESGGSYRFQEYVKAFGWEAAKKNKEVRRLYQAAGTEGGRELFGDNFWVEQLYARIPDLFDDDSRYVLTDARFTNEGEFVLDNGGTLVWIDRPGLESDGHASESGELREIADYTLTNDESLADLEEDVRFMCFMKSIYKENVAL